MEDNINEVYENYLKKKKQNPPKNEFGGFQEIINEMREKHKMSKNSNTTVETLTEEEINNLMKSVSSTEFSDN